mgnify:CR=1 FL=1
MSVYFKTLDQISSVDIVQILKLRQDIFCIEQNCLYPDIDEIDSCAIHSYLKHNGEIVAYNRIYRDEALQAHIGRICVKIDQRKNGLAGLIIRESLVLCRKEFPNSRIFISAQLHLESYYQKLGFVSIGKSYFEDAIPHIKMEHIA